jgi:hypothetical protein
MYYSRLEKHYYKVEFFRLFSSLSSANNSPSGVPEKSNPEPIVGCGWQLSHLSPQLGDISQEAKLSLTATGVQLRTLYRYIFN